MASAYRACSDIRPADLERIGKLGGYDLFRISLEAKVEGLFQ